MTKALAPLLAQNLDVIKNNKDRIAKINQAAAQLRNLESTLDDWEIDLHFAAYLKEIKDSITPDQLAIIKNLQNTRTGFLTDRPNGGYEGEVLKNILIEALTLGVRLRGNEFNILGGNLYVTKYGLARLLDELIDKNKYTVIGRENPKITPHSSGYYYLQYDIIVKDSNENIILSFSKTIPVKVRYSKGDKSYELGIDAVQGKAQRKIDNAIYSKLSKKKNLLPEGDVEDVDMPGVTQISEKVKISALDILKQSESSNENGEE